ncbi:uncharacterized protein DSM5745_04114 [Aspergillus mulundensis]|uniref:Uncharacterized protein n=1 Tax=Aspergillus mulundensis TaxID=1810919 RepID=A0A3D8SDE8_9EURO|nr:hypothetical protein DSM5745_04114 [Aspergillus mulundensis]RDW83788.1 hypothetical protein DSM5745_04114 [Aspergillus mulundensis]
MAETLDLLGVIGTWVAAFLAIIALAGIIPAYILYRTSQTEHYEAPSQIDDKNHEYISKGYTLLPGRRFFRSIRVPDLTQPPRLARNANEPEVTIHRDCALLDRDGSPSATSWVNFISLLRAYGVSPRAIGGKLKISGTETLLPVHRSWVLLMGLIDRYCWRIDYGLFVDEPSNPAWAAFGNDSLNGLSGIIDRIHPGRDKICFHMHDVTHMRSMPAYIPSRDFPPRTLLFLYLGYLPAADGSLLCSAVESGSSEGDLVPQINRTTSGPNKLVFYSMAVLEPNEVAVRDRRLADEMGIPLPKVRRLGLQRSTAARHGPWGGQVRKRDLIYDDGVEYICLESREEVAILLNVADTQTLALAALRLDLNAQLFLCGGGLAGLFNRLLSPSELENLVQKASLKVDTMQMQDVDKQSLRTAIGEIEEHQYASSRSRGRALALARLDDTLTTLKRKHAISQRAMETVAVLYLTKQDFRDFLDHDSHGKSRQAMFTIDVAQKRVCMPESNREFDFDFSAVFSLDPLDEGEKSLTLSLWQALLALLHAVVKWHIWSTVYSSRDLSAFHTPLNRTPTHPAICLVVLTALRTLEQAKEAAIAHMLRLVMRKKLRVKIVEDGIQNNQDGDDDDRISHEDENSNEDESGEKNDHRGNREPVNASMDEYKHSDKDPQGKGTSLNASEDELKGGCAGTNDDHVEQDRSFQQDGESTTTVASTADRKATTEEERARAAGEEKHLPVLEQLLAAHPRSEESSLPRKFRNVIGSIVLLARPTSVDTLAILLDESRESILCQLDELESAVTEPLVSREPMELRDGSFRDFILDPNLRHKNPLFVDEIDTHRVYSGKTPAILKDLDIHEPTSATGLSKMRFHRKFSTLAASGCTMQSKASAKSLTTAKSHAF